MKLDSLTVEFVSTFYVITNSNQKRNFVTCLLVQIIDIIIGLFFDKDSWKMGSVFCSCPSCSMHELFYHLKQESK